MAFEHDDAQEKWLERRLAPGAARFQSKVPVAGATLEIDALAESPAPDPLFDFLTQLSLFENKAPEDRFGVRDVLLLAARTLLFAHRRGLRWPELEDLTQVVLCSQATSEVHRRLRLQERRPGVFEGHFAVRLFVVEANQLPVEDVTLGFLVYYASGRKLRAAVEFAIEHDRSEHFIFLQLSRRPVWKEAKAMSNKALSAKDRDIREGIEELGIERVIEAVGQKRVIGAMDPKQVIGAMDPKQVIEAMDPKQVIGAMDPKQMIEALGGIEGLKELIRQQEAQAEPRRSKKPRPRRAKEKPSP